MFVMEKYLERLRRGLSTYFLDEREQRILRGKLKKDNYKVYYPYKDSEKNIFYVDKEPEVVLYEIVSKTPLRHQAILGSIFALNISKEMFGDILIINDKYYVYLLKLMQNYFESNFLRVGNVSIKLVERDLALLKDYERDFIPLEVIVSSERIDTVISSIIHTSRSQIEKLFKNKEVLVNYDLCKISAYRLKENDVFSIKGYGKFKYSGILKRTKSGNLVVKVLKY